MCAFSFSPNIVREDTAGSMAPVICENILDSMEPEESRTYERMSRILPGYFEYAVTIEVDSNIDETYWETSRNCQIAEQTLDIICSNYHTDFMTFDSQQSSASFEYMHTSANESQTWLLVIQMSPCVRTGEFMLKLGNMIKRCFDNQYYSCFFWTGDTGVYTINIHNTSRWIEESAMIMNGIHFSEIRIGLLAHSIARLLIDYEDSDNPDMPTESEIEFKTTRNSIEKYIHKIANRKK